MKTKIPTYIYVALAVILAIALTITFYLMVPQKQKVSNVKEINNTKTEEVDPTKDLPQPFFDENNPPPTEAVQKVELAPIPTLSKELEEAIRKTEKDIDTSDGKEIRISE